MAHLQQKTAHRVPGFITQGPKPVADLDSFRASVMKPPQPAVRLTHRYQLSQQAPKVHVYFTSHETCKQMSVIEGIWLHVTIIWAAPAIPVQIVVAPLSAV